MLFNLAEFVEFEFEFGWNSPGRIILTERDTIVMILSLMGGVASLKL